MKRKVKKLLLINICIMLTFLNCFKTISAIVSDNDGSAFVTKAEFEALKNSFNDQIDKYSNSIDNKIDGAIASYLSGIKLSNTMVLENYVKQLRTLDTRNVTFADLSTITPTVTGANGNDEIRVAGRIMSVNSAAGNGSSSNYHGHFRFSFAANNGHFTWYGNQNKGLFKMFNSTYNSSSGSEKIWYFETNDVNSSYYQWDVYQHIYYDAGNGGMGDGINNNGTTYANNFTSFKFSNTASSPDGGTFSYSPMWPWEPIMGTWCRYDTWTKNPASNWNNNIKMTYMGSGKVANSNYIWTIDKEQENVFTETKTMTYNHLKNDLGANPYLDMYSVSNIGTNATQVTKEITDVELKCKVTKSYKIPISEIGSNDASTIGRCAIYNYSGIPLTNITKVGKVKFTLNLQNTASTNIKISNERFKNEALSSASNNILYSETVNGSTTKDIEFDIPSTITLPTNLFIKVDAGSNNQVINISGDIIEIIDN